MLGFRTQRHRATALGAAARDDARALDIARQRLVRDVRSTLMRPCTLGWLFVAGLAVGWFAPTDRGGAVAPRPREPGEAGDGAAGEHAGGIWTARASKLTAAVVAGAKLYERFSGVLTMLNERAAGRDGSDRRAGYE